jgi:hypothetical protein
MITLGRQIFGWNSMTQVTGLAAMKWGAAVLESTKKEFFDQQEYRTLWCRMSMLNDVESQLRTRLEAKELGLSLPRGNEKMYLMWLKRIDEPEEHPRAMVLLQRTQVLAKRDWETLRTIACNQFGESRSGRLLKQIYSTTAPLTHPKPPSVGRQNVLLAAIKAEECGWGLDWEERITQIIHSLRSGDPIEMMKLMNELTPELEEQRMCGAFVEISFSISQKTR